MRFLDVFTALVLGAFALLSLAPEQAQGCDRGFYGGPVYYQPMPVSYRQPSYAPPVYYQPSYAPRYPQARPTTTISVGTYDNYFEPKTINVQPGTTVRWVNYGKHTHTVTSNDGRWDSGDIPPGAAYSVTFQTPGTYSYYCRHHTKDNMQGAIVVGGAGGGYGSPGSSGY
jgi:plastocyanin